jgi:four helix bundle protein
MQSGSLAVRKSCSLAVWQSGSLAVGQSGSRAVEELIFLVIFITLVKTINRAKMGTIKNFEELSIWKLSREIVNLIYRDFRDCKDFVFRKQITSAGISIMNNISEGFCRKGDAEFRRFLLISNGSAGEVKNMYYIAEDQEYISKNIADDRRKKCQSIMNASASLIKYLKG